MDALTLLSDSIIETMAEATHRAAAGRGVRAAHRSLIDGVGVAIVGSTHPVGRGVVSRLDDWSRLQGGSSRTSSLWGLDADVESPEAAALVNGSRLRCFDFNDLYFGRSRGVHLSDVIPVLVAVAEREASSGQELLDAIQVAFDVQAAFGDTLPKSSASWDYTMITAMGATCGLARLLRLPLAETQHAIAIAATMGLPPGEIESGLRTRHGGLTSWKRFNAAWASVKALRAVGFAVLGVDGPSEALSGKRGTLRLVGSTDEDLERLRTAIAAPGPVEADAVAIKRWPVGSRAQSAIAATIAALDKGSGPRDEVQRVEVRVTPGTRDHFVRWDAYKPLSMDGADHSLPSIIATVLVDGGISTGSFMDGMFDREAVLAAARDKVSIVGDAMLETGARPCFPAQVAVTWQDGTSSEAAGPALEGHGATSLSDDEVGGKFLANCEAAGFTGGDDLLRDLRAIADAGDVREVFRR